MDVKAASGVGKVSRPVVYAATLSARLLPPDTNFGRSDRKTSQANCLQTQRMRILRRGNVKAASSSDDRFDSGRPRIVDTEMIVLRIRMQELRMKETKYAPPRHWVKWEKDWSATYDTDICQFIGWLQNILINSRPGIAISALAFISLSVPAFLFSLLFQVFQVSAPLTALATEFLTRLLDV